MMKVKTVLPIVFVQGLFPFERRSLEIADRIVLAGDHASERPRRLEIDRVDGLRRAHDLAHARASVGREHVTELLSALAAHYYSLTVRRPLQVLNRT